MKTVSDADVKAALTVFYGQPGQAPADELMRRALEPFAAGQVAASPTPPQTAKFWCECCDGVGTIDERLGGEIFSNPKAKCPDCDGNGYVVGNLIAASTAPVSKAITWLTTIIETRKQALMAENAWDVDAETGAWEGPEWVRTEIETLDDLLALAEKSPVTQGSGE